MNLFATKLGIYDLADDDLNEALLKETNFLEQTETSQNKSNNLGFQSSNVDLEKPVYKTFIKKIKKHLLDYLQNYNIKPPWQCIITNIWHNKNYKYSSNLSHVHCGAEFSGSYYIKVPNDSGRIVFKNPNKHIAMSTFYDSMILKNNIYNSECHAIFPIEKTLLIFPSFIEHYVEVNKSQDPRYSIAFNLKIFND
jgi:uncharacterized protein (TIGR02466 family)